MIYRLYLLLAILAEVIGTLSMQYANITGGVIGHILMLIMISSSYILLSKAIEKIALGVAYALWEGIGILLITFFSVMVFGESISALKAIGLTALLVGIILVKSGSQKNVAKDGGSHATA